MLEFNDNVKENIGVRDFYKGKTLLITGGTGFIGKLLLEKLLLTCDGIVRIYLLIRRKKGVSIEERLQSLLCEEVFKIVHEQKPEALNKVLPVEGDISNEELYLNEGDKMYLENNVDIVIHSAANVKFDAPLDEVVLSNIRGTKHMIDFSKNIKNLIMFVYISTAYSNCNLKVIEEKVYKPKTNEQFWHDLIKLAEKTDKLTLNALTPKIIQGFPNTYTFSKHHAESMVYEYKDSLPIVLFRPSIVSFVYRHPLPGWVDNLNGPNGMLVGMYTGIIRVALGNAECLQDYVAADYVVNSLIGIMWNYGRKGKIIGCEVCNASANQFCRKLADSIERITRITEEIPADKTLWYPGCYFMKDGLIFKTLQIVLHIIPALVLDVILKISGVQFSLVKLYRKVYKASQVLDFFASETIVIKNDKIIQTYKEIPDDEKEIFYFDLTDIQTYIEDMVRVGLLGCKIFILNEEISKDNTKSARLKLKVLYGVGYAIKFIFIWIALKLVYRFFLHIFV